MKVLAFDPGKDNFAYAVINNQGKCKHYGFVRSFRSLAETKVRRNVADFKADIIGLIEKHNPDVLIFERMQHRPNRGGGAVVEYINIMLGIILGEMSRVAHLYPVSPATWKTHLAGHYGINLKKKEPFTMATQKMQVKAPPGTKRKLKGKMVAVKNVTREVVGVLADQPGYDEAMTPHEGDAIGLGCYAWYKVTGIDIVRRVLS